MSKRRPCIARPWRCAASWRAGRAPTPRRCSTSCAASMPSAMRSVRSAIGPGKVRCTARPPRWPTASRPRAAGETMPNSCSRNASPSKGTPRDPGQEAPWRNWRSRRAQAILSELVARDPSDTRYLEVQGQGHFQVGYTLATSLGRPAEAIAEYEEAIAIFQKLVDSQPEVHRLQNTLAQLHNNISASLERLGRLDEAVAPRRRAVAIWRDGRGQPRRDVAAEQPGLRPQSPRLEIDRDRPAGRGAGAAGGVAAHPAEA